MFPKSNKAEYFSEKEQRLFGRNKEPNQVLVKDYVWVWYNRRKMTGNNSARTLGDYKGYIKRYLEPFFGEQSLDDLNKAEFDKFIEWAKNQNYRGKAVSNESIKKYFVPLKMMCKDAAIEFGWGGSYDPFFGFKMPKCEKEAYEKIHPFSIDEQEQIIDVLPAHWQPFFQFAFESGLSQGEQVAIRETDINWQLKTIRIQRAMTRDENGKPIEGTCKNKFRRRTIKLSSKMLAALNDQKKIYDRFKGRYFFCSETGKMFDSSNVRIRVWKPALKKAGIPCREMRQTRHSFATYHLSQGKNPLQIAKVMGHRNAEMVIKVYSKYIDDAVGIGD